MKYSCIIVEDEILAQDVLEKYINAFSSLSLIKSFGNASEALAYLNDQSIDIIFLDVNMPELSGIDFLKILENKPQVILTTAYSEYALQGYEYSICDYLLKPIRYERFLKAVNVAIERIEKRGPDQQTVKHTLTDHIFIKENQQVHKIGFDAMLFIQAMGNYLKIFLKNKRVIVTRATINEIEKQLPGELFLRVHKSYIISLNAINKISGSLVYIDGDTIRIGTTYKQEVMKRIKELGIVPTAEL